MIKNQPGVFRQVAGATTLLLVATLVVALVITDGYRVYLQQWFGAYLLVAGIVVGVLGLWTLLEVSDLVSGRIGEPDHAHSSPRVGALLLVPIALVALAAPSSLGAGAANTASAPPPVADTPVAFPALPSDRVTELSVLDLVQRYRFGDPQLLVGKPVRLLGFVATQPGLAEGQWSINRFQIFCCVADAQLFTVVATGIEPPAAEDAWVEVEGVLDLQASGELPVLRLNSVEVVAKPEDPYL